MLSEKTKTRARVDLTLKRIVEGSTFKHKDVHDFGAKLITIGDSEETMELIDIDFVLQKILKQNYMEKIFNIQ